MTCSKQPDLRAGKWLVLTCSAFLLLGGCASQPKVDSNLSPPVWPPSPEEPKIAFVQSISRAADYGVKTPVMGRIGGWITGRSKTTDRFIKPFGVAAQPNGSLCLTDMSTGTILFLDKDARRLRTWTRLDDTRLQAPVAVAIAGETFFVADSALGQVLAFNEKGKVLFRLREPLVRPSGLALHGGNLYVADSQLHAVLIYDLSGRFIRRFGIRGEGPGELNFPTHLAVNSAGEVFVTDSMNSRVAVFTPGGEFKKQIGSVGDTSGHFSRPKGVAVDTGGRIYVLDALFDNLQIFDSEGRFLLDIGKAGEEPGEFWLPNGIAVNGSGEIFVTDSYNQRVQVFRYIGPP